MFERPEEARAALGKVLASDEFRESPRLGQLLEYLVAKVIEGEEEQIKGYAIGVDVFDKGDDFDPSKDSLVRVQMGRLRTLLDEFYAGSGREETQRLALSKGDYVPRLESGGNVPEQPEEAERPEPEPRALSKFLWPVGLAALLLIAVIAAIGWSYWSAERGPVEIAAEPVDGPSVFVSAYDISGESKVSRLLRDGLQHDLISYLSQLPNIGVFGYDSAASGANRGNRYHADFVLKGLISESGGKMRVTSNLIRMRDDAVIWSRFTEPIDIDTDDFFAAQSQIALSVASELGQPYGVIHETMRADLENHLGVPMDDYLCELRAYAYMRDKSREQLVKVRKCLEQAVKDRPNYSNAWALLAWVYGDEDRLPYAPPSNQAALRKSLDAAQRAVRANPTNAVAHQQLAIAQYYTDQPEVALESIHTALRIAPNNSEVLANSSWLLALLENNPQADELAEKAMHLNPGHPAWYWLGPTVSAMRNGEDDLALSNARRNANDRSLLSDYLLAATLHTKGLVRESCDTLGRIEKEFPAANANHRDLIGYLKLSEDVEEPIYKAVAACL